MFTCGEKQPLFFFEVLDLQVELVLVIEFGEAKVFLEDSSGVCYLVYKSKLKSRTVFSSPSVDSQRRYVWERGSYGWRVSSVFC